ncbi:hypothetical protein UlMin_038443 [Ulmus minor]
MAFRTPYYCCYFSFSFFFFLYFVRSSLQEIVPSSIHSVVDDTNDFQAYPSYFSLLQDGKFKGLIKQRPETFSLERFGEVLEKIPGSGKTVNVDDFGAKGDGSSDDTRAFRKAWNFACSSKGGAFLDVTAEKKYLVKPVEFSGPCKADVITFQIYGNIEASDDRSDYGKDGRHWLLFNNVQNLIVQGGGTINGNGNIWWKNSCKINKTLPCTDAPTAITFYNCKNLIVKNLNIKDAQQIQMQFEKCVNVQASGLTVTAPETSPNTDGIHVTNTQNIRISNSVIGTGDDCISIVNGSQNVLATDITCGPGHGISIGSLGSKNSKAYVSGIIVNRVKLIGTTNGVRIKTWQGGSGSATNITFENIEMKNVTNPIIIDQKYCDQSKPCKKQGKAVQVKNVLYKSIRGTSASDAAIKFDCSQSYPCQGIVLQDVDLKLEGEDEGTKAFCNNVKLRSIGDVSPQCN